ncbi:MAG: hypothetical protein A2939_02905 [Parcubacteria group bacterium RIFCSPLOWO2_01_FULL_48_18]|nr:MAG: hypothetical protein A2939_02905 [Parcubacteria group bacterium RIFCSPLOWO2_01_FULL_48_18]OHB23031.1 MAG: hypothetical protein A3J67_04055 [Parcubacteria group bacterium RIFCSPHIGHO2_02_FULL_48_10b]
MKINTTALIRSSIVTIWYLVAVTIDGEIYKPLKDFFVSVARHHWTGKSVFAVGVFAVLYLALSRMKESNNPENGIRALMINTVLGGLFIFGFFIWHFLAA